MSTVASEELVRLLLASTGEGIYGIDLNGLCTFANPACVSILGFGGAEELLGQHMHNLVHHTRPDGTPYPEKECRIYQAFRGGKGTHFDDEVMFRKDGTSFPVEYWSYPMEQDGQLVGCVLTFVDITERREVEAELLESHEFVRLLLDSTGEGIYGVDLKGNCTFANPACAELLGFESVDVLLGKQMHELVHHTRPNGEPYPVEECQIYQAFIKGKGTNIDDEVMFCADGEPFPAEYWSYPVRKDGELVGCVVTFNDITDRRRIEEDLRQAEKMAALGKMSAGLTHELNNPAAAAGRAAGQLIGGWVAVAETVCGVVGLSCDETGNSGEVNALFIDPEWKRKGIGRLLWQKLVERAAQKGIKYLRLDADPSAVRFYKALGLQTVREVPSGSIAGRTLPQMTITLD